MVQIITKLCAIFFFLLLLFSFEPIKQNQPQIKARITTEQNKGKIIVINIAEQRLYAYENGISLFSEPVPIVTGKSGYETVRGEFSILEKNSPYEMTSPFRTEQYDSVVTYWLPFFEDYGIHDAWWRSSYGEQNYLEQGTHGCVNVPFSQMEQLFAWAEKGTFVIVK